MPTLLIQGEKYTIEEAAKRCGVESDTVRIWIKDGLPAFVDEDGVERIKSEPLSAFLQLKNDSKVLTLYFNLDKCGETWESHTQMINHAFTKKRMISLHAGIELKRQWNECLNFEKSLADVDNKYGIKTEISERPGTKNDFNFLEIYRRLSVKEISELCGTTKKTVFSWKDKGLELKRKKTERGDLYATSGDLISFLLSHKDYLKYLQTVLGCPLSDFAKQLKDRKAAHKVIFNKQKEQLLAEFEALCKKFHDVIEKENIELLPIADRNQVISHGKPTRAEKFIIEKVIKKSRSYVPGKEREAIGKEVLRKMTILSSNNKDYKSEIKNRWIEIRRHRAALFLKVNFDERAKSFLQRADKDKVYDIYLDSVKLEGMETIQIDLLEIGLTSDFIKNKLISIKPNPFRKIVCHIIPDRQFTLPTIITTLNLLDYLDATTSDVLMQLHFLKGKYRLCELQVYAVCRFLHKHIWRENSSISKPKRVAAVACLLDIRIQRVNEIILESDPKLKIRIKNLLNPNWGDFPEDDISNLFETEIVPENKKPKEEKDEDYIEAITKNSIFDPYENENGFSTDIFSYSSNGIEYFTEICDKFIHAKLSYEVAIESIKEAVIRDHGKLGISKEAIAKAIEKAKEEYDDEVMNNKLRDMLTELRNLS